MLVTGALGNVGREVARACASAGFTVRAANRSVEALRARCPDAEAVRFDYLDRATWDAALAGCDFVFLLRPPPLADMAATLNPFVDAAYRAGVHHIVFLSVAGADRMRWVPHRSVELHLAATGNAWTVLRPGFFAQNLEDAYRRDITDDGRLYVPASVLGYAWHLWRRRGLPWMQVLVQIVLHVGLRRGDAEAVDPTVREVLGRDPTSMEGYLARINAKLRAT